MMQIMLLIVFWIICLPAYAQEEAEEETSVLITLSLVAREDNRVHATIQGLTDQGTELGLDALVLKGEMVRQEVISHQANIHISWDGAEYQDKHVEFDLPFISQFWIPEDYELIADDTFRAMGDPAELIAAWEKLQAEAEETEEAEAEPEEEEDSKRKQENRTAASAAQQPVITQDNRAEHFIDPNVEETSNGCEIIIDYEQEVAIVQERTLIDGVEESPCSPSLTRYPLTKEYTGCDVAEEIAELRAYESYSLGFIHPDTGSRNQVTPCEADPDRYIQMVETEEGCSPLETVSGLSEQARLVYTLRGQEVEVRTCQDKGSLQEYTVTRVGCSVRVDTDTMQAIEQVRKIYYHDGEEIEVEGCTDSNDSYALIETHEGCTVQEDLQEEQAIQQTLLYYVNDSDIQVQARGCQNSDTIYAMTRDTEDCSIRHDFEAGVSYQQSKLVYTLPERDGKAALDVQAQGCIDDPATSYAHTSTTDGCDSVVDDVAGVVTLSFRKYIEPEGERSYITSCMPDASSTVPIEVENCTGDDAFTHDFVAGQSYRNVTYYYTYNGEWTDISICEASEETFTHLVDEAAEGCSVTNFDALLVYQIQGRTYIEPDGELLYISDCFEVGAPIAYSEDGTTYVVAATQSNVEVAIGAADPADTAYRFQMRYDVDTHAVHGCEGNAVDNWPEGWSCDRWGIYAPWGETFSSNQTDDSTAVEVEPNDDSYCFYNKAYLPWSVEGTGEAISDTYSDTLPEVYGHSTSCNFCGQDRAWRYDISCAGVRCATLSTVNEVQIYRRGDDTPYVAEDVILSTQKVCGDGSLLTGG